jgi:hypothetical protein
MYVDFKSRVLPYIKHWENFLFFIFIFLPLILRKYHGKKNEIRWGILKTEDPVPFLHLFLGFLLERII